MLSEFLSMLEDSRKDTGRFWNLDPRRIGAEPHAHKPDEEWDTTAEGMMLNFAESGHPVFRASSALEGGELKSKAKGKKFIHFNGSDETIELILSAIISVNQLSVYGAVAALCKELARDLSGAGKPAAHEIWNRWWYRENLLLLTLFLRLMRKNNESCCVNTSRNSQNFLNNRNWWPNSAPTLVFRRILTKGQCFTTLDEEGVDDMKGSCRDQSWMCMSAVIKDVTVLGSWSNLYFETERFLGFASWTESTNTWPKRQKKFLLQALKTEVQGNLTRTFLHGPMTWKVMQRNVWNDTSNWRTKQLNSSTKSQHRCMDDHQFKEEENGSVGELSPVCSQLAPKCLYVACMWPALGDLIFCGSCTNLLLLAYHSMDQSLWQNVQHVLISYSHHTCELKHYCHVGNTAQQCRLRLFQDSDFCRRSWGFKIYIRWNIVHFWKSYVCSNQLDV